MRPLQYSHIMQCSRKAIGPSDIAYDFAKCLMICSKSSDILSNHLKNFSLTLRIEMSDDFFKMSDDLFNTLRPRQNGRHFPDDIFKCIFMNENVWISIKIPLKIVPKGQINNFPTLFQIIFFSDNGLTPTRRQAIIWNNDGHFTDAYMRHSASMS